MDAYTRRLVLGVNDHRGDIDALLERHLRDWSVARLATVERSILRLAVFEVVYAEDVPAEVAIDEAVELAKRYASNEAATLVNGVLGAVHADPAAWGGVYSGPAMTLLETLALPDDLRDLSPAQQRQLAARAARGDHRHHRPHRGSPGRQPGRGGAHHRPPCRAPVAHATRSCGTWATRPTRTSC